MARTMQTSRRATRKKPDPNKMLALVTGGNGFLGRHIVQHLLEDGRFDVRVFDLRLPADKEKGVEYVAGDLRKVEDVEAACQSVDVVFHVATAAPTGANAYNHELMRSVNVDGTCNVINACVTQGVPRLVYTSSASVVFEGKNLLGVDEETTPYAARPLDYYTVTKIEGEKAVLEANGRGGLATCALRPSGIFGEYDQLLVNTTVNNARKGKLKYIIGDGKNLMDWTYAGNVADAHINAADALEQGCAEGVAGGQAYFITNDDPQPFWGFMGDLCQGLGYPRPHIHLPFYLIFFIACIVQYILVPLLSPFKKIESDFTPSRITIASVNRVFSCEKAKRDLGYCPAVDMEEALERTVEHFEHLHADNADTDK